MARLPQRVDYEGAVHHVWGRGNGKRPIFHDAEDYRFFLKRLSSLKQELGFEILGYCLMPNHYHLIIRTGPVGLSRIMHRLLTSYSRVFNDRWGLVGHPFQGRFKNRVLLDDAALRVAVHYVHANPLDARLVDTLADWSWSGHHALLGRDDGIMSRDEVLSLFGGRAEYEAGLIARTPSSHVLPALEEIAAAFGCAQELRSRSQARRLSSQRKEFAEEAVRLGYRQSQVAKFLGRTESWISQILRDS